MDAVFCSSVYIVADEGVLLGLHRRERTWLPVGGKRWPDETPLETARREAREEAGCAPAFLPNPTGIHGAPDGFFAYEEHRTARDRTHMCFAFVATVPAREVVTLCAREFSETRWATWADLPEMAWPFDARNVPQLARIALHLVKGHCHYGRTAPPEAIVCPDPRAHRVERPRDPLPAPR